MSTVYTAEEWRALVKQLPAPEGLVFYNIPCSPEVIATLMDGEFVRRDGVHCRMTGVELDTVAKTMTPIYHQDVPVK